MPARATTPLAERVLALCPPLVAILWVAGVARFRQFELEPVEWAVVVAAGFAMHVLVRRFSRPRPLPQLPEGARPVPLAAFAATLVALLAAAIGGVVEAIAPGAEDCPVPWGLRTVWHSACAFGASYCSFLGRLLRATRR